MTENTKTRKRTHSPQAGFTLVEVMVAVLVFALGLMAMACAEGAYYNVLINLAGLKDLDQSEAPGFLPTAVLAAGALWYIGVRLLMILRKLKGS